MKNIKYNLASDSWDGEEISAINDVINSNRYTCLLYTSPSPRDLSTSRMPSSA